MQQDEIGPYLNTICKKSKWIKHLNVKPETAESQKKTREMLHDSGLGNDILDMTPKVLATKAKIDKWDYIKLKSFCTANETVKRVKRHPTEWEKIFVNHISDEGLISKLYRELTQHNRKKI